MQHRQLGRDGPMVSVVGFGAWPLSGTMGQVDLQTAVATVRAAIDHGITLLDTAQGYGVAEEMMGHALKDGYRERCFLATKVSHEYSREDIRSAIENSLRKLEVEYVDLYQVHSWKPQYPIEETMEVLVRLQEEGKIRFIGVSNFSVENMQQALRSARFHSNQPGYSMYHRKVEEEILPFCQQEGIGTLAHSPLGKGLLTGKYKPDHRFLEDDYRSQRPDFQGEVFARYLATSARLAEVARDKSISLVQLAIAWLLRLEAVTCVLVGAKNPQQVAEQAGAADVTFSQDELARIEEILADAPKR